MKLIIKKRIGSGNHKYALLMDNLAAHKTKNVISIIKYALLIYLGSSVLIG